MTDPAHRVDRHVIDGAEHVVVDGKCTNAECTSGRFLIRRAATRALSNEEFASSMRALRGEPERRLGIPAGVEVGEWLRIRFVEFLNSTAAIPPPDSGGSSGFLGPAFQVWLEEHRPAGFPLYVERIDVEYSATPQRLKTASAWVRHSGMDGDSATTQVNARVAKATDRRWT